MMRNTSIEFYGWAPPFDEATAKKGYQVISSFTPHKEGIKPAAMAPYTKCAYHLRREYEAAGKWIKGYETKERTYIMIKPDGVQRGLIGKIISRFEQKGLKLVAMKLCKPGKAHMKEHYEDLADRPFFKRLVAYMCSAPVCCMVWEGDNAVKTGRKMLGATKPFDSESGTIRGDNCVDVGCNIIHGSDSVESANKEIALWFDNPAMLNCYYDHSLP